MSSDHTIIVDNVSKCYEMYKCPADRLKQFFTFSNKQYYQEFWAIKNISFSIAKGETVGLIGKNGSGKSTILQMICGTVTPTSGSISSNGRIAALLELGAGFNPEFTGLENVYLNAEILGISREIMKDKISLILDFSELGDKLYQPVKTYSSGMFARLAFSVAIHVNPDILIVDEALAVGDAKFVAKCMKKIKDIQAQGSSILFVSHDISSIRMLCDRVIWLDDGKKVEDGEVFPITGRYMEFMFKDEEQKNIEIEVKTPADTLDTRPVTHWGSHKGLILSASVINEQGIKADCFNWNEKINISIKVNIPTEISRENLSVAFSIKDLKGTDLIVSTTKDMTDIILPEKENFNVIFLMRNNLVTGQYLLAVTIEKRKHGDIHYFEYIEGTHYFSSLAQQQFFGIFQPNIQQNITNGEYSEEHKF